MSLQRIADATTVTIDIAATFKALYGYLPAHIPSLPPSPPNQPDNIGINAKSRMRQPVGGLWPIQAQTSTLRDMLGRAVMLPITLIVSGTGGAPATNYDFPFALLSLKNKKIMKETPMVERGGSVIEEIGIGPWEIDVKGFLIDQFDQFPDNQLAALNTLYLANQSGTGVSSVQTVKLRCALSDIFLGGNPNVVITELEIPAKAKVIGVRDFSFKLVQDSILDLYKVSSTVQATTIIS